MTCEVRNKEINSQCAELLVHPLYIIITNYIHYLILNIKIAVFKILGENVIPKFHPKSIFLLLCY